MVHKSMYYSSAIIKMEYNLLILLYLLSINFVLVSMYHDIRREMIEK